MWIYPLSSFHTQLNFRKTYWSSHIKVDKCQRSLLLLAEKLLVMEVFLHKCIYFLIYQCRDHSFRFFSAYEELSSCSSSSRSPVIYPPYPHNLHFCRINLKVWRNSKRYNSETYNDSSCNKFNTGNKVIYC